MTLRWMTDSDQLVKQAQTGDELAFEQLLQQCYDQMFRFAIKWSGNRTNAEDITHQSCIKLAKSLKSYRFECAFSSWLYRLVINSAIDWQRSQQRHLHDELDTDTQACELAADSAAESELYLRQVMKLIAEFGEGYRETVALVFGEGLSHREAAEVLAVKESTVSWRIHDIRKRLAPLTAGGD